MKFCEIFKNLSDFESKSPRWIKMHRTQWGYFVQFWKKTTKDKKL